MNTTKYFLVFALLVVSSITNICMAAPSSYNVAISLLHDNTPFATPHLVVKPGVPATVQVTGQAGYRLSLTVTTLKQDEAKVAARLTSEYGRISPTVVVRLGQSGTVKVGDLSIVLTVNPSSS